MVEPRWGHLIDYTYDGLRMRSGSGARLSSGLGQLVDGVRGPDNFSLNNGFEWVGWKSMNGDVVIEFAFRTLRNFTGALLHSNNLFSSGVEVFQALDVHYGIDPRLAGEALRDELLERRRRQSPGSAQTSFTGSLAEGAPSDPMRPAGTLWSGDVLSIEYEPDKKLESSRPVMVHLKQRLANRLRFVLKFASKWILLSEAEFASHPVELMALSSLSDQFTPALLEALDESASTYDEYVAILREHQLRRIATDAFLETLGPTSDLAAVTPMQPLAPSRPEPEAGPTSGPQTVVQSAGPMQQQQEQFARGFSFNFGQPPPMLAEQPAVPATNPLLGQPHSAHDLPAGMLGPPPSAPSGPGRQLPESVRATPAATAAALSGLACLLLLGALLGLASYRRGCARLAHRRLHHHLAQQRRQQQQHLFPGHCGSSSSASTTNTTKNLMSDVFGPPSTGQSGAPQLSSNALLGAYSSAPSQPLGLGPNGIERPRNHAHQHHQQQQVADSLGAGGSLMGQEFAANSSAGSSEAGSSGSSAGSSSHYNPLFATGPVQSVSGGQQAFSKGTTVGTSLHMNGATLLASSRAGRPAQSGASGPLSLLRNKLSKTLRGSPSLATSMAAAAHHKAPLFANSPHHTQTQTRRHQLLVSLKDSIATTNVEPSPFALGSPMQQQQQLIVGLNQANPLAQQQIYCGTTALGCSTREPTYMATSTDYATPELGLSGPSSLAQPFAEPNGFQTMPTGARSQMISNSSLAQQHQQHENNNLIQFRQTQQQQQQQQQQQYQEHNYELVYGDHPQQTPQTIITTRVLPNLHQRRLGNNQLGNADSNSDTQQRVANSAFNSMTLLHGNNNNSSDQRQKPPSHNEQQSNNLYYYADTEAASQPTGK